MIQTILTMMAVTAILIAVVAVIAAITERLTTIIAANTYDAAVETHLDTVSRTNDAAVTARHLLWAAGSAATGVQLASATLPALGTIDNTESGTGVAQTVLLLGRGATKKVVASGAISDGAPVFQAADGKVAAVGSICVGIALTASASDGDLLEIDDSPAATGRGASPAEVVAATNVITANESGKTFFLASATEFVSTLPAPALGLRFKFVVSAAPSGTSYTIVTASSANIILGAFASAADAGGSMDSESSGGDTITFVDGQALVGDWVEVISDGTSWFATGIAADEDAITITTAS